LISQYLHAKPNTALARTFDEEVLGVGRGKQQLEAVEEVERALLGEFTIQATSACVFKAQKD
jgi:hypothetical protein